MEVESQSTAVTNSRGRAKGKNGLREHMAKERQNSFDDLVNEGRAFANSNHSDENLFDDFDDPFEDERDHATTVTPPLDKSERPRREASPKGVDEQIGFDPFSGFSTTSSFYQKRDFDDVHSGDDDGGDVEKSPLQQKLQNIRATRKAEAPFSAPSTTKGRRSTMSHFAPVSPSMTPLMKSDSGFELPGEPRDGKPTDRRAGWSRRSSVSDLNLSSHSSQSCQSDTTGAATSGFSGIKTPRRAGRRPGTDSGMDGSLHRSGHGQRRPAWGRYASMTNLNRPSETSEMPAGFAVPATPCAAVQKLSAQAFSPANPLRRGSIGTTQMLPTPKKPSTKMMVRRASVATGLGVETKAMTPKLTRRASVATGLGDDPSTPVASMRVRIRQQRKSIATGATPGQPKVNEDMVRRLVKEHLAKTRQRKEQEQKGKEDDGHDTTEEDETERSDSDDESTNSFEDDASATTNSSRSSCSSRWEDDGDRTDEVPPRLLKRYESNDFDTLLPGWSPADNRGAAAERVPGVRESEEEANEDDEERKVRKKTKKVKKVKKEKKEKKVKKDRKEKKKSKSKAKGRGSSENVVDDDETSAHPDVEETTKSNSSGASFALVDNDNIDRVRAAEVLSAIKLATKKKDKSKKSRKTKKKDQEV